MQMFVLIKIEHEHDNTKKKNWGKCELCSLISPKMDKIYDLTQLFSFFSQGVCPTVKLILDWSESATKQLYSPEEMDI